jgi:hypothetical protein
MRCALLALFLVSTSAIAAPEASSPEVPNLEWFEGEWVGTGIFFAQPSIVTLSVMPALGGTATALAYRAQTAASPPRPALLFEGRATYRIIAKGRVEGQWNDSNGSQHSVGGRIAGTMMTTIWGSPTTELGRSTYARDAAGTLTVTDSVLAPDGGWRIFATATYRKK